ncbi:hypothetical protein C8A01DRAFT_11780 [Parachaetomium inaequale]|uniref:Uncharacterized protein n=1 Tax=Parachaetomium inaequale TaxID=2588326 RepID=A0AAN6SWN6_9PEZI|nr:hypothetical protein C8A01DRAFT_11780 [Parachaetomium inaequale]
MFEVDWKDYDCERVGQRRARKEVEREKKRKDDASSGHRTLSTISSRTSTSSDQHHRKFFGAIGRKKSTAFSKSKNQEPTTPKPESTASDGTFKRSSMRFSGISAASAIMPPRNSLMGLENKPPNIQPPVALKGTADVGQPSSPESPDRSSRGIRMTQLTIPTLESRGEESMAEAATTIDLVQVLDNQGSFVDGIVKTSYQQGRTKPPNATQIGVGTKITASPRTPKTPRPPRNSHSPLSPDGDDAKSGSELIDDWFTALHGPTRQLPRPGPNGTIRRGNVLLPPNVSRPLPETPTRRSAERDVFLPPNPSPIRFSADNPDDWRPLDEWDRASSTDTQVPVPVDEGDGAQEDEEDGKQDGEAILRLMAADLKAIHIQEEANQDNECTQQDDEHPAELAADKIRGSSSHPGLAEEKAVTRESDRSVRTTI